MSGIFGKVKDYVWGAMNAPDTEEVDDTSDGWYDSRSERDDYWEMPHERESRNYDYDAPRRKDKRESARQAQNNKVLEMYNKGEVKTEIILRHPMDVGEASKVCDFIRENKMCVVDLTGMERNMAQRIADFLGGACYAVNGCIQRISKDIFIIVPDGVRISGDVRDELEKDGYAIPKAHGRR